MPLLDDFFALPERTKSYLLDAWDAFNAAGEKSQANREEAMKYLAMEGPAMRAHGEAMLVNDPQRIAEGFAGPGAIKAVGPGFSKLLDFAKAKAAEPQVTQWSNPISVVTPEGTFAPGYASGTPLGHAIRHVYEHRLTDPGEELAAATKYLYGELTKALRQGANNPEWLEKAYYGPLRKLEEWERKGGATLQEGATVYQFGRE